MLGQYRGDHPQITRYAEILTLGNFFEPDLLKK
jgi:hypothetical protein